MAWNRISRDQIVWIAGVRREDDALSYAVGVADRTGVPVIPDAMRYLSEFLADSRH